MGQENTARIKLKNKLSKRLLAIEIIQGQVNAGDIIRNGDVEIGKVLIDEDYPFAVIKLDTNKFNFNSIYDVNDAKLKINKPDWIN